MDKDRRVLEISQDQMMSYLRGDAWTAHNFSKQVSDLERLSAERYSEIISILQQYSLPKNKHQKNKYLRKYRKDLIDRLSPFYSKEIEENYSVIDPLKLI